jgi:hypothetical protein
MRPLALLLLCSFALYADNNYKKVTVCARGCDYGLSSMEFQQALNDAAAYQVSSCIPYIIEGAGGSTLPVIVASFILPVKTCAQYVEIRSSLGSRFTPGQRYNPATDDGNAFNFQGKSHGIMFLTAAAGTRYWRFRNIRFSTTPGAVYSSLISWGQSYNSQFSINAFPDHLEVIQCGLEGLGQEDVGSGIGIGADNVSIRDSYVGNISKYGTDSQAITVAWGSVIELRNNYFSAVDETLGLGGGSIAPSGLLPTFEYIIGNNITKEPWMNHTHANGVPTKPCFQGNWYTDDSGPTDYLCTAVSGVWEKQSSLLPYGSRHVKNLVEAKLGLGLRIVGNSAGPIAAQATQDPYFIMFNLVTQPAGWCGSDPTLPQPCDRPQPWSTIADVWIEGNHVHDGFSAISLGGSAVTAPDGFVYNNCAVNPTPPCYTYAHHGIKFRNNLLSNISDERNYCLDINSSYCWTATNGGGAMGMFGFSGGQFDLEFSHNTLTISRTTPASGRVYMSGVTPNASNMSGTVNVHDNIFPTGQYGLPGPGAFNGCALQVMMTPAAALYNSKNILTNESIGYPWSDFATGPIGPTCRTDGNYWKWPLDHVSIPSSASILDSDFRVAGGSGYQGWGSDGRDPGADIDQINWRSAHAIDGAPNPALDYAIRSVLPTSNGTGRGLQIYFTAPSGNACTWELSLDPNLYSTPVAVSSQTRNGRDGFAVWNNGTLTPGKAYWARATCDGYKLEEIANGDRAYGITVP